eukprot:1434543-Amphidinium_carterae.1
MVMANGLMCVMPKSLDDDDDDDDDDDNDLNHSAQGLLWRNWPITTSNACHAIASAILHTE